MNSDQFARYLARNYGIKAETKPGTGHKVLFNPANGRRTEIPMHGGNKQLKKGLMKGILKQLGIAEGR